MCTTRIKGPFLFIIYKQQGGTLRTEHRHKMHFLCNGKQRNNRYRIIWTYILLVPNNEQYSIQNFREIFYSKLESANLLQRRSGTWLFGTWLGMIRITWGKSPEWFGRRPRLTKGHYRCTANLCYWWNSRYEASQSVGWTQPFIPHDQQSLV